MNPPSAMLRYGINDTRFLGSGKTDLIFRYESYA